LSKKIKEVSESIKSKLSFEDYKVFPEGHNAINTPTHKEVGEEKVKCTFYLPKTYQRTLEKLYFKLNLNDDEEKISRSMLMKTALDSLFERYHEVINGN